MKKEIYKSIEDMTLEEIMNQKCHWTKKDVINDINICDYWSTSCGNAFIINEGTPYQNKMKFCPYCGQPIKARKK